MPAALQQRSSSGPSLKSPITQTAFQREEWAQGRIFLWTLLEGFPRSIPKSTTRSLLPSLGSSRISETNFSPLLTSPHLSTAHVAGRGRKAAWLRLFNKKITKLKCPNSKVNHFCKPLPVISNCLGVFIALVSG